MEQLAREEALLRKMEEKYAYQDDDSETIDGKLKVKYWILLKNEDWINIKK